MEYHLKPKPKTTPSVDPGLNTAQAEAVLHQEGPLLIIAGAGSGKTKTLVHRVAHLIRYGVQPEKIILLTFTRKAAQEMLKRAVHLGDPRCSAVSGGTFHAFAGTVLRRFGTHIGYTSNFTILDRSDAEDTISLVRQELNMAKTDKRFPKKSTLSDMFSKTRNTQKPLTSIVGQDYPQFYDFIPDIQNLFEAYQTYKTRIQVMDYDDLLIKLLMLLQEVDSVRTQIQQFAEFIMVDEYQDTNTIQADIVGLLAGEKRNLCVVGDDAQSIYSFRGAHFKNIIQFPERFPGTKIIRLEENYRSTQPILDLSNAVMQQAREGYSKQLFSSRQGGIKPIYVETDSDNTQSRFICQKILELREEGFSLRDMAVLMRSGWHSNDLEIECQGHGIPFVKLGGFKFMDASHIKDLLAFLKVIQNPLEKVSWQRILLLLDGVGPKAVETIWEVIQQAVQRGERPDPLYFHAKSYGKDVGAVFRLVFLCDVAQRPADILGKILEFYKPIFKHRYDDFTKRQTDLNSLHTISERYPNLEVCLTELSLEPPDATEPEEGSPNDDDGKLTLSTIHSAKGLEWKIVFVLSALDGYLPSFQSLGDLGQIDEERRLFYVALTRAKDQLFVVKPQLESPHYYTRHQGDYLVKPTRFLEQGNVVERFMDKWTLVEEHAGAFSAPIFDHPFEDLFEKPSEKKRRKYYF
jgi:DNA helicase-2/ATP-dependent DNA helicase PcrA